MTTARLYVPDADATHRRAVEAGGTPVTEVTHLFFGDRVGRVRDPFGNLWWIQTRIEDVSPEEMGRRLGDPVFTKAMAYVQGADFFWDREGRGGTVRRPVGGARRPTGRRATVKLPAAALRLAGSGHPS